jgi:hypothetical protein
MMSVEQSVEWELEEGTEVLGGNLPQCHFDHHKSLVSNPGRRRGKPATNRLNYDMAYENTNGTISLYRLEYFAWI